MTLQIDEYWKSVRAARADRWVREDLQKQLEAERLEQERLARLAEHKRLLETHNLPQLTGWNSLETFDFSCAWCWRDFKRRPNPRWGRYEDEGVRFDYVYHHDHIIASSLGGGWTQFNLVPACPRCNCSKGAKPIDDWIANLRTFSDAAKRAVFVARHYFSLPKDVQERIERTRY